MHVHLYTHRKCRRTNIQSLEQPFHDVHKPQYSYPFPSCLVCLLSLWYHRARSGQAQLLPDQLCFQYTAQPELFRRPIFVKELDMVHRHTSFHCDLLYCVSQIFFFNFSFTNWKQEPPPAKRLQFALLWYLLYCDGLELNPQYPWGMPVKGCFLYRRCKVSIRYFWEILSAVSTPFNS